MASTNKLWLTGPAGTGLAEILDDKFNGNVRSTAYLRHLEEWYVRSKSAITDGELVVLVLGSGGYTARIGSVKPNHQRLVWLLRPEINDEQARRAIIDVFDHRPDLHTVLCVRPDAHALGGLYISDWGQRAGSSDKLVTALKAEGVKFGSNGPYSAGAIVQPTGAGSPAAPTPEMAKDALQDIDWSEVRVEDVVSLARIDGSEEPILRALSALAAGMNVIFVGPPGTGKTTLAAAIFGAAGVGYDLRCASDHWTTYDTIGGYFPEPDAQGQSRLVFRPGALLQSIQLGQCIIVDEINRADIDRAFGELFTLFGSRQSLELRLPLKVANSEGDLEDVVLTRSGADGVLPEVVDGFRIDVPPSWRMIGSMNDADRASLKRLSLAFARRFAMIPVRIPDEKHYTSLLRARGDEEAQRLGATAAAVLPRLLDLLVSVFVSPSGLTGLGVPLGPGFAITVLEQALSEVARMPSRPTERAFMSALELYVAPQFQGLAVKHSELLELVRRVTGSDDAACAEFDQALGAWTGGAVSF